MTDPKAALGAPLARLEGRDKVTGRARYANDHTPPGSVFAWPVPATVARGEITAIDDRQALAHPAVLAVLTHLNAPPLAEAEDPTLALLQSPQVAYRGQYVALVVAETLEAARTAAAELRISYRSERHDVVLTDDHPGIYAPELANAGYPADRERGDFDTAFESAEVRTDAVYRIGPLHNHPMEPHAATAVWDGDRLTVYDSCQGGNSVQQTLATLFALPHSQILVISEHVGGGFGSKGTARPQAVLAAMAARTVRRPVKLALPRAQLCAVVGHRAPTVQRVRLAARSDGRLHGVAHEVLTRSSTLSEFVEQAAVPARVMYASPHSRTTHRVVRQDVPAPSWMRAPGECPGMFALESAMDELAQACGLDPIELRLRNEPELEPDSGRPFSSRHLTDCLREGARRFGWYPRDPEPRRRSRGRLLIGSGVAASTYPVYVAPSSAEVRAEADGSFTVLINATDIGTGARTVLAQIAAHVLGVATDRVGVEIGRSDLPPASLAGGSSGTASWGWPVHRAATALREDLARHGEVPAGGLAARAATGAEDLAASRSFARHAFGAQFAEVQVDMDTGETRVRRLLGVFAAGRILNPRTARAQLLGGMIMGQSMALSEHSTLDPEFGDHAERDLASYQVAVHADVTDVQAYWIEEEDPHLNPMGSKGIGELGIVGTAAAITNAVHHATGIRVRDLPATPDVLLGR
ncbi:xanthine dehydrogenase family protein molybdopterin-binding subunit [Kitasatospora sp. GP82]|uniref:xanthine dehydrogenase family protein molybdopterin-binding subunit n=1 Tax=Kitasatospora sp. GP82 TaxID=3035089 RepID=UPI0024770AE2|nr:xanthine dehydrogenase family protein molybdopterin-binding subunit [Kitasatospora sp. GP82]MDH6126951.1 xanthine dehydrogenase YagR molybdenum-binding subunit [Kitasatospora sp. GP82]